MNNAENLVGFFAVIASGGSFVRLFWLSGETRRFRWLIDLVAGVCGFCVMGFVVAMMMGLR